MVTQDIFEIKTISKKWETDHENTIDLNILNNLHLNILIGKESNDNVSVVKRDDLSININVKILWFTWPKRKRTEKDKTKYSMLIT